LRQDSKKQDQMKTFDRISRTAKYGFPKRRPSHPLLVIFHITTRCNMACLHCADDVWGDPANDLSLEEIAGFSLGLGVVESLALGGGEPFLRDDLAEICWLFAKNNKVGSISIPSNGFAPERIHRSVQSILECCPGLALNIMLSLDGFEETHDAIRRPGSFVKVMETATKLKELSKQNPNLSVSFNSTINNRNCAELPSLARFVACEFQARLEFNIIAGNPRDAALTVPPVNELQQTVHELLNVSRRSPLRRLYNKVYQDVLLKANLESRQVVPCRAGSLVCLVDANGDVRSCPVLPPVGNLRSKKFHEIWHGTEARKQFDTISNGNCSCNNDCFIRLSLMNYWRLPFMMLHKIPERS